MKHQTAPLKRLYTLAVLSFAVFALTVSGAVVAGNRTRTAARPSVNGSHNTNRNHNTNVNRNTSRNTNVNVNVDADRGWDRGYHHHPVATAVEVTAAVAVTSAVIGSVVHSVPSSGCTTTIVNGLAYQQCGGSWYQPQYAGSNVTYIVVAAPR